MKKSIGAKTIVYPTPVLIIGTYDADNKANLMAVAWGGICCSQPPCIAISLRQATYTYGNIITHKAFTVNIPSEKYVKEADYCGIVSGKNEDKFKELHLTPVKSDKVYAPYIKEFPLTLECAVIKVIEIGLHTQFIGHIMDVKVEDDVFDDKGRPDIKKIKPFSYAPESRTYHGTGAYLGEAFSIGQK